MIKRLQKNIILVNVLLVGTVLLLIFAAVCINSYTTERTNLEHALIQVLDKGPNDKLPPDMFGGKKHGNQPMRLNSYISVTADYNAEILSTDMHNAKIDGYSLEQAVKIAVAQGNRAGEIGKYDLMFAKEEKAETITVIFADSSGVYSNLWSTLAVCTGLFAAGLLVVFFISLALSGIAVNPVKAAWEKQKHFVADASHELKTPLTVILANNNIVMAHKSSTVQEEMKWLQSTEEEAHHMKRLIDQMLFLAKSDADSKPPELREVNVSELIEATALNFEPIAYEKEITIERIIQKDITAKSSPTLFTQLSHILIDNAVKYAEQASVVTIRLEKIRERICFSVNNRGNVISADDIEHIFDRFYRAEKSRTSGGFGLGLSIAKNIVKTLGGKISVKSDEQTGTTFTVKFLPVK
ncbi:MAG: sensor histidine kinase [Acutalibacteraceae bacterium]